MCSAAFLYFLQAAKCLYRDDARMQVSTLPLCRSGGGDGSDLGVVRTGGGILVNLACLVRRIVKQRGCGAFNLQEPSFNDSSIISRHALIAELFLCSFFQFSFLYFL